MTILDRIERLLFESSRRTFVLLLLTLMVVKMGVGIVPNAGYFAVIAENPFANHIDAMRADYFLWSWLGPFIVWALGLSGGGAGAYFLVHMVFLAAFVALFFLIAFRRFEADDSRKTLALFAMLPVSTTALYWIGYDSLTLLLMTLALAFPGRRLVAAIAGALLGMQHFEQGFFAAGALLFATLLSRRRNEAALYPLAHCLAFLVGVALGKLALMLIFHFAGIEVRNGRWDWLVANLHKMAVEFWFASQYIVYSIFGVGWLAAVKFWDNRRNRLPFFLTLFGLCLLLPISEDETRVIAIASFPIVLAYWLFEPGFLGSISRREAAVAFLIWFLAPWAWVWQGVPRLSALPYFVIYGP